MSTSISAKVPLRIAGLLLALIGLFAAAMGGIKYVEKRSFQDIVAAETEEHGRLLDSLLLHAARPLQLFVTTYARRTSFTRPHEAPRASSPESTLRTGLRTFNLDAAWVLEADGSIRLHEGSDDRTSLLAAPVTGGQLASFTSRTVSFYMERDGTLFRVRGSRLAADPTHPGADRGWLFAAKRWDAEVLAPPALPIEGRLSLVPPSVAGDPPSKDAPVRLERILRDVNQQPLRVLRVDYRPDEVDIAVANEWLESMVMVTFGLITLGVLLFCLVRWVINPAATIQRILAERNLSALEPLRRSGGYLGRLAELVYQLLTAQDRLQKTLDERARLGRELHDGAIQTIYAAGMGIATARATLRHSPADAEQLLDETRAELNATIVDLRSFIGSVEPETAQKRSLSEAVRAIASLIESAQQVRFDVQIDTAISRSLSETQNLHVLQIVREAISNAVRHGAATLITVSLRREARGIVLEIIDDGRGLAARESGDGGRGLGNFQARAAELGGTVTVESASSGGVCVRVCL